MKKTPLEDHIGKSINRLTLKAVVRIPHKIRPGTNSKFDCTCECGKSVLADTWKVLSGHTKSCGCIAGTHRMAGTPTYVAWVSMLGRTHWKHKQYEERYWGRGIGVCEPWLKFENFLADMGARPDGRSLDRIDNDKGYSPENCRWATQAEQLRNTSRTVKLTVVGEEMCRKDAAEVLGLHSCTLRYRLKRGWTHERALSTPTIAMDRIIEWLGESMTLTKAAELAGLTKTCLRTRLSRGWTLERAMTTPAGIPRGKINSPVSNTTDGN